MASQELTGATPSEVETLRGRYHQSPQYLEHGIPFEVAYCLRDIARQPDDYDGPQRVCKRRVKKKDPEDYEGGPKDEAAFAMFCHTHGGDQEKNGREQAKHLDDPETAAITHGAYADDENLKMDFTDEEQELHDSIMEDWPEIYDWPPRSEDPARYRILRRVAVNEVRALREEDYLDNHEVHVEEIPTENGVQTKEVENPLAREYRLLMSEVTDQMRELGLTPKARQKMDSLSSQADKDDALSRVASDALHSDDQDFDPDKFEDGDNE